MGTPVDHRNPITLSRFILAEKEIQTNADLSILFSSIELACKVIASAVRRAGLTGLYGLDGSENSTGDAVKKLDLLANDIFINSLKVRFLKSQSSCCFLVESVVLHMCARTRMSVAETVSGTDKCCVFLPRPVLDQDRGDGLGGERRPHLCRQRVGRRR